MSNSFDRSIAVVIGINEYQNGIEPLQTPVSDAIAIATRLRDNYQYQFIHPSFESGVIVNQFATKDQLETLFKDILPNKIQPTQRDHLLFYFAGHGIARNSDGKLQGFLIPQDGNIKQQDSLLRMIDLHDWLSQLQCRHLLVILDCCFADKFRWASTRKLIPIPEKIHWEHYHRFILASSGDDGTTRLCTLHERELKKWQGDNNGVHDLVFSHDLAKLRLKLKIK